jgi:hypothetical protein
MTSEELLAAILVCMHIYRWIPWLDKMIMNVTEVVSWTHGVYYGSNN